MNDSVYYNTQAKSLSSEYFKTIIYYSQFKIDSRILTYVNLTCFWIHIFSLFFFPLHFQILVLKKGQLCLQNELMCLQKTRIRLKSNNQLHLRIYEHRVIISVLITAKHQSPEKLREIGNNSDQFAKIHSFRYSTFYTITD